VRRAALESLAALGARPALEALARDPRTLPEDRAYAAGLLHPVVPEPAPAPAPLPPGPMLGPPAPAPAPEPEPAPPTTDHAGAPRPGEPLAPPVPVAPLPPPEVAPEVPADGLPLAVATSAAAGGALFPLLSLMSGLDSPGALILTGSAGAVIGAG